MDIVIRLEKLGQNLKKIDDCCSGRSSWTKGELIVKKVTVVRVDEDRTEEVSNNCFSISLAKIGILEMGLLSEVSGDLILGTGVIMLVFHCVGTTD